MVALLESDRHRIVDIFASVSPAEVRFPDDSLFHNINTMSDYHEARMTARASSSGAAPAGEAAAGAGRDRRQGSRSHHRAHGDALARTREARPARRYCRAAFARPRDRSPGRRPVVRRPGGRARLVVAAPERLAFPLTARAARRPLRTSRATPWATSTSSSQKGSSALHLIASSSSAAARAATRRLRPRAKPWPWSRTPMCVTRTASLSATRPAWRDSSPRAWTRCARTDARRRAPGETDDRLGSLAFHRVAAPAGSPRAGLGVMRSCDARATLSVVV